MRSHVRNSLLAVSALALWAWVHPTPTAAAAPPHVEAASAIEAGRYLVVVQGCNDCHTAGWNQNPKLPESQWLTGNPVGYRGPWGTSYATNLRRMFARISEDKWVEEAHKLHGDPPMPNESVRQMSDSDLRAVHAFIHSLGAAGERAPRGLKPGQTPTTPYMDFSVVQPH